MAQLHISWAPVPGAFAYRIRWRYKEGSQFLTFIQTVAERSPALLLARAVILDIPDESDVYVVVSALDAQGREGERSQEFLHTATKSVIPLPAPANVIIRAQGGL